MNKRLHDFVLKTIKKMIGQVPDWEVSEYALGWYSKKVLTEEDIILIDELIEAQYPSEVEIEEETELVSNDLEGEE